MTRRSRFYFYWRYHAGRLLGGAGGLALWWFAAVAAAQVDGGAEFSAQTFQTDHGLPQRAVVAILPARDGYLWIGTYGGLVRFDGDRFTAFTASSTPGLQDSSATALCEDDAGGLWIGHESGGLTRLTGGVFETMQPGSARSGPVLGLAVDARADLWQVTEREGLRRVRDGAALPAVPGVAMPPSSPMDLTADRARALWITQNNRAARVVDDALERWPHAGDADAIVRLCAGRDGGLWVLTGAGLHRVRGETWETISRQVPWEAEQVSQLRDTRASGLVAGTVTRGLFIRLPGGDWVNVNRTNGLPDNWVRALAEDREGNLWVGTSGGLTVLRPRKVGLHNPPDGWQGKPVQPVLHRRNGELWAGTEGAGLYRLKDGVWRRFAAEEGLGNSFVWSLLEDRHGRLWAGTWRGGIFRLEEGEDRFIRVPELEAVTESVTAMTEAPDGALWLGTGLGLARFFEGRLEWFGTDKPPLLPDVRAVALTPGGAVWAGSVRHGLARLEGGKFERFGSAEGLASHSISTLHGQAPDTLWIGTLDAGLIRYRNGRFAVVGPTNGLPSSSVFHLADDGRGFFWCSSPVGVFRVAQSDLNACADGTLAQVPVILYGRGEGLPMPTCTGGFQPAGCRTPDGHLWFPTGQGLVEINPAAVRPSQLPPPVFIEEAALNGEPAALSLSDESEPVRQLLVPPGRHRLQIRYTGVGFTAPERVRFRYQLEGLEPGMVEVGPRRSAFYSFLAPGRYRFRVTACNHDGVWQAEPAELVVIVLPAWWQTLWARVLGGVLAVGALGGGAWLAERLRTRQRVERLAREQALARERARIAQDIHDDLGASLTRISMLSEAAADDPPDPRETARSLAQISTTARELTRAMDEIVWAVNPRHDTLDSLVNYLVRYAQDFLTAADLRCRLDVPVQLPHRPLRAELRHNLFLAYKEALNNAVKHARATEVKVSLEFAAEEVRLTVADNGVGFQPASPGQPAGAGCENRIASGNGLENMRRRLGLIGGRCEIDSVPSEGTRVKFTVPLTGKG